MRVPAGGTRNRGQILVLAAVAMVPLLGMAGIAVDLGNLYLRSRTLQLGADAAALAGMRTIASGVPGVTFTTTDVQSALTTLLSANAPGATVTTQQLLWGASSNADQCLSSGVVNTVNLATASISDLWTAHCLLVVGSLTVPTYFAQVLGFSSFTIQATTTATAAPVTAMAGLRPITIPDSAIVVNGAPATPWGPSWDNNIASKPCTQWLLAPVPHAIAPEPACPLGENMSPYKGLVNFLGPPSPPSENTGPSNSSGCHYHQHTLPSGETQEVGWNNPLHSHPLIPWTGPWSNSVYQKDTGYTNCTNSASFNAAVGYWATNGYGGVISAGPAVDGEGDFFTLNNGNLGANFHTPLSSACTPPSMVIYLPVFDSVSDPNHNSQITVHMGSFAALQISCPLPPPSSSVTGTFVQSPVPPDLVRQTGGSRQVGASNVTILKLVG